MLEKILGIAGWAGVVLAFSGLGVRIMRPQYDRYAVWAVLAGCVLAVLSSVVLGLMSKRRQARYGTLATTSVLVLLGVLVAVNYLSTRRNKRWDLTANSVNSLSEQSDKVLRNLDAPLRMILFERSSNFDRHRERLSQYDLASDQVAVEYIDGDREPDRTKKYEVQSYPTLVLDYKGKTEKVTSVEERDITGGIIRAVTGQQRKMYFVQGHGEKDPKGTEGPGYAGVVGLMSGDNITVDSLVLANAKDVPTDATILAIVGPTTDFLDSEIDAVRRYLTGGGRMLLMIDPALGDKDVPLPRLTALAKEWGVDIGNDVVLDLSGRTNSATFAVAAPPYPAHPITDNFRVMTVFPLARSTTAEASPPAGRTVQPVAQTEAGWAETDLKGLRAGTEPQMNAESGDKQGPVTIGVTVTTASQEPPADEAKKDGNGAALKPPQTRVAVFGDSDFASNAYGGQVGNADFFMNTVNWLTAQENLIAIRPREAGDSRLTITPQQMNMVWWLSVVILPALILGAGIFAWTRRAKA